MTRYVLTLNVPTTCKMAGKGHHLLKTVVKKCPHSVFYSKFTREGPYKKVGRPQNVSELIRQAIYGFEDVTFVPYRLVGYRLGRSFTQSSIEIKPVDGQVNHKGIHTYISVPAAEGFHSIFKDGFERLQQSIDGNISSSDTESSNEDNLEDSISDLKAGFLRKIDFHEKCLQEIRDIPWHIQEPELFVTELLANHLFSKLTMSSLVIATDYCTKLSKCPCSRCNDTIQFNNFGIGSEWLWYGAPDIVVYKSDNEINSIALPHSNEDEKEDKELLKELDFEEQQILKVQKQSEILRYPSNVSQFVAHAITFSYYQKAFQHRHRKIENLQNNVSLVPLIAISGNFFDIYLYDCENDILLRNANQISLWNEQEFKCSADFEFPEPTLNLSSVLMIWMVMNHLTIKPSLSDETVLRFKKSCGLDLSVELQKAIGKTVKLKKNFYPLQSCDIIEPYFSQMCKVESQQ
ncbi:uncharacterized protein [Mytilus edulis]|uniref:uncharacterized protein n=2 Tax=Mytilus edulis TaxID=6550 RepID=UPI0039EEF611